MVIQTNSVHKWEIKKNLMVSDNTLLIDSGLPSPDMVFTVSIRNNAWVIMNNDLLSLVRRFGNDFHEWQSHEWKSLSNRLTSDKKKIVIHGNECIILLLTCYFMPWIHNSAKNNYQSQFVIVTKDSLFWPSYWCGLLTFNFSPPGIHGLACKKIKLQPVQ